MCSRGSLKSIHATLMGVKREKDLGKQVSFSLQVSIMLGWGMQNKRGAPEMVSPLEKTGKF